MGGVAAQMLSFSGDRQWVAYRNATDGALWRARPDGSQAVQLTFAPLDAFHPTWSPDGKVITFEGSGRLYSVPFEGGTIDPLLPEGTRDGQPSSSPDGKMLVFLRWLPGKRQIALLDLGTRQVQLVAGSEGYECPRWSPDGKYIVANDQSKEKLMLFEVARRQWSELASAAVHGWGIRWSSDSAYVYYQQYFAAEQPIFRVSIRDHKVEQITSLRQILRADLMSYTMNGLTPDNSPLVSLLHTNSDVHALELDVP